MSASRRRRWPVLLLVVALALAPLVLPTHQITLANNIGIYALVTLGLVLLTGVGGMTSFGQAAFLGIGAYAAAFLAVTPDLPSVLGWLQQSPLGGLALGLVLTLAVAAVLGALTLSLSGHYLPLGTIAWGLSIYYLFGTQEWLNKYSGLTDIPPLKLFGIDLGSTEALYYLIWLVLALAIIAVLNLLDSRPGRAIRALSGGQMMARSMGVDVTGAKMAAFLIAAAFAGIAGWLYAYTQRFVNPTPFSLQAGIEYMFMALIGGVSSVWGALIGAAAVTFSKEWLQDVLPHLLGRTGNFEAIVFGLLVVLLMHRMPAGLAVTLGRRLGLGRSVPTPPTGTVEPLPRRERAASGETMLSVRSLSRRFGGLIANQDISFDVKAGEILAVIGPNGAGKSTLFNQLSAVDTPTSGDIFFRGQKINGIGQREVARLGLNRTFQHVKILPTMSALENVAIGAHLRGHKSLISAILRLDRGEEARLLKEAETQLVRVGLGDHLASEAGSLALGQQRILEIARALASDPLLLLLDEPAAGLRHKEKEALGDLLRILRSEGIAVLLVEHDMDFVMGLADRVLVINFGQTIAEGTPDQVQSNPAVLEAYLGGVE
ncbi:ABC transporter permease subunit [Segnochrobactraceae bacterium EtOH-i3]